MSTSIGIDLGTTNTAVAVVVDGRPRVLEDEKGYKVLPSCVSSRGQGRYVIGQAAKNLVLSQPENTVYAIKRLMGRRFDSEEVQATRKRVGYTIIESSDGKTQVQLGDEFLTPVQVSSVILKVARQIAERGIDGPVSEAVVTVPAYFTHAQREATLEAVHGAGLRCDRLLNEPTAAALAYGFRKDIDRTLLIFDLGGGTFDVCVLRLSAGIYEILVTSGDSSLGGEDFDYRLVDHMADHFQSINGTDLREDRITKQRLKDAAERAKCELSFTASTNVLIPQVFQSTNLELVISRPTLESLVGDLVARTLDLTRSTIKDAGLQLGQIDDVIMVGGQTRMPKIREAITGLFGKEPNRSIHPEEAVAIGAAVHANSLSDTSASAPLLLDVTPFDLGIDSLGGMFTPIINRNGKIPASKTRLFATVHDNQDRVRFIVRQGDSPRADENEFLGEFVMEGITPLPRMEAKLEVNFRLDVNGMLQVRAVEVGTGEQKQITIRNYAEVAHSHMEGTEDLVEPLIVGENGVPVPRTAPPPVHKSPSPIPRAVEPSGKPAAPSNNLRSGSGIPVIGALLGRLRGKPVVQTRAEDESAPSNLPESAPLDDLEEDSAILLDEAAPAQGTDSRSSPGAEHDVALELDFTAGGSPKDIRIDLPDLDVKLNEEEALLPVEPDEYLDEFSEDASIKAAVGLAGGGFDAVGESPFSDEDDEDESWDLEAEAVLLDTRDSPVPQVESYAGGSPDHENESHPTDDSDEKLGSDPLLDDTPRPEAFESLDELEDVLLDGDDDLLEPMKDDFSDHSIPLEDDFEKNTDELPGSPGTEPEHKGDWDGPPPFDPRLDVGDASLSKPFTGETYRAPPSDLDDRPLRSDSHESTATPTEVMSTRPPGPPKPARLRMHYRNVETFVAEYRENLRQGGTFIQTPKPLRLGRECIFEIHAPGLERALTFAGKVTSSTRDQPELASDVTRGMAIEYRMSDQKRQEIEEILRRLSR